MIRNNENLKEKCHAMNQAYLMDENQCINALLVQAALPEDLLFEVDNTAKQLVTEIREQRVKKSSLDAFLHEYDLSSEEGIVLMCLAEAMLRIPDTETIDDLIRDKITAADWEAKLGKSESFFINASTWALMLTGKIVAHSDSNKLTMVLKSLLRRSSEPLIRKALGHAMKVLGKQFVMGRTIQEALKRSKEQDEYYRHSFDMLGEAARTQIDAEFYYQAYCKAITEIAKYAIHSDPFANPGISIKLSALHPRYEYTKREQVVKKVVPLLLNLARQAKAAGINLTVDAEEARVLELSLEIFAEVYHDSSLNDWHGFGLAVQSYQKRAWYVLDFLITLCQIQKRKIPVRLIKGAYWDSEIKYAQVHGLEGYPVFTRKNSTDVSFIACARKILAHPEVFYAQFGSHNAYSAAVILALTKGRTDFEFQCLHGMGRALYDLVTQQHQVPCRIYAPVGSHKVLLSYLVRRLLENGANTSFVNRLADTKIPLSEVILNPVARVKNLATKFHPEIPLPREIYGKTRKNSKGINLSNNDEQQKFLLELNEYYKKEWRADSIIAGKIIKTSDKQKVLSPANSQVVVGYYSNLDEQGTLQAIEVAAKAFNKWAETPIEKRAQCLLCVADLLEARISQFVGLMVKEGGKTLVDAISEVREAIDFCRYYACQAKENLKSVLLQGATGEFNQLSYYGRGPIVCISPWNFPLAIFLGQITAALVTGNVVLAKPAEQTPLVAFYAVSLLHEAGFPVESVQLLLGRGEVVGAQLVKDERIKGIMFTGSTHTAQLINQALAARKGEIIPFIAETGGQNTMIADSSALLEQVVVDVMASAFGSAGQRCSALRVLYIQDDIAEDFIKILKGAMAELEIGNPVKLSTDTGPVIDTEARAMLTQHYARMSQEAKLIYQLKLPANCEQGTYFAPCAFEIKSISQLDKEIFGPFLHVIRFKYAGLDKVLADITATGYGLTQGIHSRIGERIDYIINHLSVGNLYVNRNMIGAVVGVQPFGGQGLSGTGPKAGGPNYLHRLVTERVLTIDTTASGGNATLLTLTEDN
ncbi:MAG: bifunctional proline dehydrogenase/L-glutamate gamma-semialdehyde dehydrogenase [Gammaproteobacteria bacterium RIFCSPHIGHO2_12_FULL_35_23]|nr:MAG: bifunctional proline dehydrogenase/L-glutamate gamma-semialdehyde dehydrogenase [Gammaproteobacteria bacterium RIFCSPHIGHO2_12_FULL_35_23]